jgi:hypothetical protein
MAGWWFSPGTSDFSSIKTDGWLEKTTIQPSVLMEEESEVPGEKHQPAISFNGRGIRSTRRKPPSSHQF